MPTQGPGTKIVLKGLKLAFPGIAEKRAREEQEDREYRERKNASRNGDGDNRPSARSKAASHRNFNQPEENMRQESIRRGPSVHSNGGIQGSRNQSSGRTRSGSLRQATTNNPNGGSRRSRFEDGMPPESIRRGPSNSGSRRSQHPLKEETKFRPDIEEVRYTHSSNRSGSQKGQHPLKDETKFRPDIEEVRYTHSSNRSGQSLVRQDGPSRQSGFSGGSSSNIRPRRTASMQGVVGSRGTNGRRS